MAVLECDRPTIPFMKSRRRIAFPKAGTSLIRTRLQQGFAEGGMGSDRHFAWLLRTECLLWVKSGHRGWLMECPLYPQKRTLELSRVMSNREYRRTHGAAAPAVCGGPVFQARTASDRLGAKGSLHSD